MSRKKKETQTIGFPIKEEPIVEKPKNVQSEPKIHLQKYLVDNDLSKMQIAQLKSQFANRDQYTVAEWKILIEKEFSRRLS